MAKQTFTTGQVLTAAQMTSLQQTAMLGGAASAKTASYTLVAADAGTAISMSNASATTITVNTALFAAGDTVNITNLGVGVCTITAGTATVNTSASLALAQYESGTLDFTSTSAAIFIKGAAGAAASGGMTLLSTTALSGASVTLSSISQDYKSLYLVIYGVTNATANGQFYVNPNSNTSDNAWQALILATGDGSTGNLKLTGTNSVLRTNADNVWTITFNNYTSTTNYKTFSWNAMFAATDGNPRPIIGGGGFLSNSAISSINILNSGGNLSTGSVELYGVK